MIPILGVLFIVIGGVFIFIGANTHGLIISCTGTILWALGFVAGCLLDVMKALSHVNLTLHGIDPETNQPYKK